MHELKDILNSEKINRGRLFMVVKLMSVSSMCTVIPFCTSENMSVTGIHNFHTVMGIFIQFSWMWKFVFQFSLLVQTKHKWISATGLPSKREFLVTSWKQPPFIIVNKFRNNIILDYYCTIFYNTELYVGRKWAERKLYL